MPVLEEMEFIGAFFTAFAGDAAIWTPPFHPILPLISLGELRLVVLRLAAFSSICDSTRVFRLSVCVAEVLVV